MGTSPALEVPSVVALFTKQSCFKCHNDDTQEGNLNLAMRSFELNDLNALSVWTKVHDRVRDSEMPPKSALK